VKEVDDKFLALTQQVRRQKEAVRKRLAVAPDDVAPKAPVEVRGTVPAEEAVCADQDADDKAHVIRNIEQLLRGGYDFTPWQVIVSEKVARPFFYNMELKLGQFAVPPSLAVAIEDPGSVLGAHICTTGSISGSDGIAVGSSTRALPELSQEDRVRTVENGAPASCSTKEPVTSEPSASQRSVENSNSTRAASTRRVTRRTPPEDEEESPFHLLGSAIEPLDGAGPSGADDDPFGSAASATVAKVLGYPTTAASTAMDLPGPTPYPRAAGIASRDLSLLSADSSAASNWGAGETGATAPTQQGRAKQNSQASSAFDDDLLDLTTAPAVSSSSSSSASKEWSCVACTYINGLHTYTCEICGTVDKAVQNRFNKPLLRSGAITSSGTMSFSQQPGSQKKRTSQGISAGVTKKRRR
jgi:hypothetical protein